MYSLCFICCGYLSLGGSCISQSVKSKEKAVLPCVFCPPACCTCECFPLTTSSPSLFPPNINSFPFWFRNISLGTSSYSPASFHMIFPYSTILPQKAEKPSHTGWHLLPHKWAKILAWSWLEKKSSNPWFNKPSRSTSTTLPVVAGPAVSTHVPLCPLAGLTLWCPSHQPWWVTPAIQWALLTSLAQNEILWFEPESRTQFLTRNPLCCALITYLSHGKLLSLSVGGAKNVHFKAPKRCALGSLAWGYE